MAARRVVVVGGANTDIVGRPDAPLVSRDSNPGHVRVSAGGVGRNVAENLARLGIWVELVTALGSDANAAFLAEECARDGISLEHSLRVDVPGSVYLAILDSSGDMTLAISDMRALDELTPDALSGRAPAFAGVDTVVADANLPADALAWLSEHVAAPLVVDTVSVAKAGRVKPLIPRLAALRCNAAEAGALLGREIEGHGPGALAKAASELRARGAGRVFLTAGARGTWFAGPEGDGSVPGPGVEVMNATGAGDAFTAGVVFGMLEDLGTRTAAGCGSALAALTLASPRTVSPAVSRAVLDAALVDL